MDIQISMVSLNPTVGALSANADSIYAAYLEAVFQGATIVLTPEMSLCGYPLQDLTQRPAFLADIETERKRLMDRIRASGHQAAIVFGHATDTGKHDGNRRLVYNSATFYDPIEDRSHEVHKTELPNYGVFDEYRNYLAGGQNRVVEYRGLRFGLIICEDGWLPTVVDSLAAQGADALLWVNGSPFSAGKNVKRRRHAQNRIDRAQVPIAYVNLVGCQDELVFDGDCFSWDGHSYVETDLFVETVRTVTFDIERGQAWRKKKSPMKAMPIQKPTGMGESYRADVRGMRDYAAKTGFSRVLIGMSGGLDSAAAASVCTDALGAENVLLVRLPSSLSSSGSLTDAMAARDLLGCPMRTIAIQGVVAALRDAYSTAQYDTPAYHGAAGERQLTGVASENVQARARGDILMAIANEEGYLLVTTGNRSEISVGYFTLYGDSCGGYNVLKDAYKTQLSVAAGRTVTSEADIAALSLEFGAGMVQWRNALTSGDIERYGFKGPAGHTVPFEIVAKAESAELAEDQKDSNSLPLYPVLDGITRCLVDRYMGINEIMGFDRTDPEMRDILGDMRIDPRESVDDAVARGFDREQVKRVNRLINQSEHKRRQTAPGPKTGDMLYGQDRRMPIINAYRG